MEIKYDNVGWVYVRDRKILVNRSFGKEIFFVPGGKREGVEQDIDTLLREMHEEMSVHLDPGSVSYLQTFEAQVHGKPEGVFVRLACYTADYTGELTPSSEIEAMDWFSYADKERTSPVSQLVFDHLKSKGFID